MVVEDIRRCEFGKGADLSEAAEELWTRQQERLGRALTRLSKELYSSNTHFVLELVQNADDNSYTPGVVPAVEFLLLPGAVVVINNETGLTAADVRALCDVGASTKKGAAAGGCIGYKGLGFKSVFKVTDAPQMHSRGYHIKFDLEADPALGYVLPSWVSDAESSAAVTAAASGRLGLPAESCTTIMLPLKTASLTDPSMQGGLRERLAEMQPALLLFLHRLQCLCVSDALQPASSNVMLKRQLGRHVVELRHGNKAQHTQHWLVVRSSLTLPAAWHSRYQGMHDDHSSLPTGSFSPEHQQTNTELALAFSLDNPKQPCQQPVYAFLPMRTYGLRFVLQADWQMPSSREAVDADMEGEAQGFFAALPYSVSAQLRSSCCIPTESGALAKPYEVLVCSNGAVRRLVSSQQLQALLGKQFVHADVAVLHTSPQLRRLLGVGEFSPLQVVELVEQMAATGIDESWLTQLQMLSVELFVGLSLEDREMMTAGLMVLGVRVLRPIDIMQQAVLPAFKSAAALSWSPERLVAALAFPLIAGLVPLAIPPAPTAAAPAAFAAAADAAVSFAAGASPHPHIHGQQQSSSVYLPAGMTSHSMDWQQDLPQLFWRVITAAYQERHPDLPWAEWLCLLGVQTLPPLVRRQVTVADLQKKQQGAAGALAGAADAAAVAKGSIHPPSSAADICLDEGGKPGPGGAAPIKGNTNSNCSWDQLVTDWCCPDLEAVLAAMTVKQLDKGSSSSSTTYASRSQHGSMCKLLQLLDAYWDLYGPYVFTCPAGISSLGQAAAPGSDTRMLSDSGAAAGTTATPLPPARQRQGVAPSDADHCCLLPEPTAPLLRRHFSRIAATGAMSSLHSSSFAASRQPAPPSAHPLLLTQSPAVAGLPYTTPVLLTARPQGARTAKTLARTGRRSSFGSGSILGGSSMVAGASSSILHSSGLSGKLTWQGNAAVLLTPAPAAAAAGGAVGQCSSVTPRKRRRSLQQMLSRPLAAAGGPDTGTPPSGTTKHAAGAGGADVGPEPHMGPLQDTAGSAGQPGPGDKGTGSFGQNTSSGSSAGAPALQAGRFYCLSELCLTDPSQVMELVACHSLAAAVAVADAAGDAAMAIDGEELEVLPRPVAQHYPGQQLFTSILGAEGAAEGSSASCSTAGDGSRQGLLLERPGVQQYLSAICWLAQDTAAAGGGRSSPLQQGQSLDHWAQILAVLSVLAGWLQEGVLGKQQLQLLQAKLRQPDLLWLWSYNRQSWVGGTQEPVVADDPKLAAVMQQVPGVCLVKLEQAPQAHQLQDQQRQQPAATAAGDGRMKQLLRLLALLDVHGISKAVSADVAYEELTDWHEMAAVIAGALLAAQRWAWHSKSVIDYQAMSAALLPKLSFLTVVAVRDLAITYSLEVEGGVMVTSPSVPAAVLQHDMQLLVAPDRPALLLELSQQLARLVSTSLADVAPLSDLLLLVLHELSKGESAELLLKSRGILPLPAAPAVPGAGVAGAIQPWALYVPPALETMLEEYEEWQEVVEEEEEEEEKEREDGQNSDTAVLQEADKLQEAVSIQLATGGQAKVVGQQPLTASELAEVQQAVQQVFQHSAVAASVATAVLHYFFNKFQVATAAAALAAPGKVSKERLMAGVAECVEAVAQGLGLAYGCREHVAFVAALLGKLPKHVMGRPINWLNICNLYPGQNLPAMKQVLQQGLLRCVDVTWMKQLVLWELSTIPTGLQEASTPGCWGTRGTGRWGEQLVAVYLALELVGVAEVTWVNDRQETGLPYDIVARHPDGRVEYFEVKTSVNQIGEGRLIPITMNELAEAAKRNGSYSVVRVFGCPSNEERPGHLEVASVMAAGALQDSQLASIEGPSAAATDPASQVRLAPGRRFVEGAAAAAAKAAAGGKRRRQDVVRPRAGSRELCLLFIKDPVQLLKRRVVSLRLTV
eukprot:gene3174-3452_t